MRTSSLIGHTVEALDLFRVSHQPSDLLLKEFFRKRRYLGSKDRRFIAEAYYGVLRNFRLMEFLVDETARTFSPPISAQPVPSVALYAAYAVSTLRADPGELAPDLAGVWRTFADESVCAPFLSMCGSIEPSDVLYQDPVRRIAIEQSFPDEIVREWIDRFGLAEAEALCASLNQPAPITLRVNSLKCSTDECLASLEGEGLLPGRGKYSPWALVLERRVNINAIKSFQQGCFEMQDEGSQLVSMLVEARPGAMIVDACAGGGGKTLHLAAMMDNRGAIAAVDVDERRLLHLEQRIARAGVTIVRMFHGIRDSDALADLRGRADAVLVDAPCSGVGTFRRNPGAKLTFSAEHIAALADVQQSVLSEASRFVRVAGRLVYATCTLLRRENEQIIEAFLARHPEFDVCPAAAILRRQGIELRSDEPYLLLLPHRNSTDGFFAAVMERRSVDS